jgi:hypothetical protein
MLPKFMMLFPILSPFSNHEAYQPALPLTPVPQQQTRDSHPQNQPNRKKSLPKFQLSFAVSAMLAAPQSGPAFTGFPSSEDRVVTAGTITRSPIATSSIGAAVPSAPASLETESAIGQ